MRSVWGIDHGEISKGLPSALRGAKAAKGSYGALRQTAHAQGKIAGAEKTLMRSKKPGWTTHQYNMNMAHRTGSFAATDARKTIGGGKGNIGAIGAKPGAKKKSGYELFGRGPSKYSGMAKPYSRQA